MKEYKARIADKILAEKLDAMGAVLNLIRELSECREMFIRHWWMCIRQCRMSVRHCRISIRHWRIENIRGGNDSFYYFFLVNT